MPRLLRRCGWTNNSRHLSLSRKASTINRIAFSVVLVGLGVATGLFVSSGLAEPTAVVRGPNVDTLTALRKERRDVLRQAVKQTEPGYRSGVMPYTSVLRVTISLLNVDLDLAPNHAGRVAVRERIVEQLKINEKTIAEAVKSGTAEDPEVLEAKATRLQAEIDLSLEIANGK